jgi:hypothetical protein
VRLSRLRPPRKELSNCFRRVAVAVAGVNLHNPLPSTSRICLQFESFRLCKIYQAIAFKTMDGVDELLDQTSTPTSTTVSTHPVAVLPLQRSFRHPPPPSQEESRSSSSSSGRKRRRNSPTDSGFAVATVVDTFSITTKQIVTALTVDKSCWPCGATPVECCHVINRKDLGFHKRPESSVVRQILSSSCGNLVGLTPPPSCSDRAGQLLQATARRCSSPGWAG